MFTIFTATILTILITRAATAAGQNSSNQEHECSSQTANFSQGLLVICRVSSTLEMLKLVRRPIDVVNLDLSNNGLTSLDPEVLIKFSNLQVMNVSGNPSLRLHDVDLINLLPRLTVLDVSWNADWLNADHVKNNSKLRIIRGTPLDGNCLRCFLTMRPFTISQGVKPWINHIFKEMTYALELPIVRYRGCYGNLISLKDSSYREFESLGYNLTCIVKNERCFHGSLRLTYFRDYETRALNRCWQVINKSSILLIVLATIAIAMNTAVVAVTMRSKALKSNVACNMIASVAFGNLIIAWYLFVITVTRALLSYHEMEELTSMTMFCHFVGFGFIMSQALSGCAMFIVSLERYLAVVYCIKPNIRIFPETAKFATIIVFILSFSLAILPFTALSEYYIPDSHCVPISQGSRHIQYVVIPGGLVMVLYICTIPLYIHMYVVIKNSSRSAGINREGKVARKISLVVFSSMILFFLPLATLGIVNFTPLHNLFPLKEKHIFWKTFAYYSIALCTCLNPCLFAFRNEKFRLALRHQLHLEPKNVVTPRNNSGFTLRVSGPKQKSDD